MVEVYSENPHIRVAILAQFEAEELAAPEEKFVVVSITSPREPLADLRHLGSAAGIFRMAFREGKLTPSDAKRFWEFFREHSSGLQQIVIRCGAGAVRSAALGVALLEAWGGDDLPIWAECSPDEESVRVVLEAYHDLRESHDTTSQP